ncbi:aminodeoxychorismate synthase component I, partial [Staphylococcus aureus]|nr:aminodeoxychorismate synthase component I [Staphylococcus aureus]
FIKKYVATKLADVGEVIHFAQAQQRQGRYVSLYLSYEAAKYFNHAMCTHSLAKDDIYAAAYSFEKAESINSTYEHQTSYVSKYHFSFVESSEVMMTNIKRVQQAIVEGETYQVN